MLKPAHKKLTIGVAACAMALLLPLTASERIRPVQAAGQQMQELPLLGAALFHRGPRSPQIGHALLTPPRISERVSATRLIGTLRALTKEIGSRSVGTWGNREAREYLRENLQALG